MVQFQYAQKDGSMATIEAPDSASALKTISGYGNAHANSGVIEVKPTPSIVSSSSVITDKNKNDAMNNAGNNLTGPKNPVDTTPPDGSYYQNGKLVKPGDKGYKTLTSNNNIDDINNVVNPILQQAMNEASLSKKALEMTYNAALASNNAKYADLHNQLTTSYNNSIDIATDNAVALNPYSSSRGATTSANFKQKITDNYHEASAQLEQQADLAQQQLEAGNYAAYVQIQNGLDKIISNTISSTNSMLLDFKKQAEQTRQFDATFGMNEKNIAFDNAMNAFKTANYSPEDMNKLIDSGQIYGDPAFQNFFKASGSDPASIPGILNMLKGGSIAAAKLDLEAKRVSISAQNANIAQANYYNKLSNSLPTPGQVVVASNNVPVSLTKEESDFFVSAKDLDRTASKVLKLLDEIPTDAITGWTTKKGYLLPVVQNELDPKQQELMNEIAHMNNTYLYASSGKAINEHEMTRLAEELGSPKGTTAYNKAVVTIFKDRINQKVNDTLDTNGWKIYGGSEPSSADTKVEIPTNINDIFSKYGVNTK